MDEQRESSLLFSLEGLMETERERVQREAREARERREAEIRLVADAAQRRNSLLRAQHEARARRDALLRERERFEQEQLEALKQATIERARIEAESGLRLVEAEQQRKHDLELARVREQQGAARHRALAWLSSGALAVALLGGSSAYFGWIAPAHARAEQHLESKLRESAARTRALEHALAAEQSKSRSLSAELEMRQVPAAPKPAAQAPKNTAPAVPPARPTRERRGNCRDSGDPLDDCLR